jgi:hypothetical protein
MVVYFNLPITAVRAKTIYCKTVILYAVQSVGEKNGVEIADEMICAAPENQM